MNARSTTSRLAYATILIVAATVILLQVALTRIVSATASYHSVFIVLSVVMLGIAAAAVRVYRDVRQFDRSARYRSAVQSLVRGGACTVIGLFVYLAAFRFGMFGPFSAGYAVLAAVLFYPPFYSSGYVIAFLLHEFAAQVGRLYWFDLVGAAAGCFAVVFLLDALGAPNVVNLCGVLFVVCSFLLPHSLKTRSGDWVPTVIGALTVALFLLQVALPGSAYNSSPHGRSGELLLDERWNSLAKIAVYREAESLDQAVSEFLRTHPEERRNKEYLKRLWGSGWGLSARYDGPVADQYYLDIDSGASTTIVGAANAGPEELEFLRWDVTAIGYWLLQEPMKSRAFIVGGGGGRDILLARQFGVPEVRVVELNPEIVSSVEDEFGEFSGRPYSMLGVSLTIGEARSTIQRSEADYDIIQMSMIDTWAATSSGAFVLAENNLYTIEAVSALIEKLKHGGLLSVSRWYRPDYPGEIGRMLTLIRSALQSVGISDPRAHVAIVHNRGYLETSVATFLVQRTPFSSDRISSLRETSQRLGFSVLWPAGDSSPEAKLVDALLMGSTTIAGLEEFDFRPSTDEWPFFFNLKRPLYSWVKAAELRDLSVGSLATLTMVVVVVLLSLATLRLVYRPLQSIRSRAGSTERVSEMARYFAGIGFGFMVIELGLVQRFILFLGHPTYALTVVLFTLLLFSGIGSLLSGKIVTDCHAMARSLPIVIAFGGGLFSAFVLPPLIASMFHAELPLRILIAVACVTPFALAMGMILPIGIFMLKERGQEGLVPLMWGVNGISGVFGSVIGMWVATAFGYTAVFLLGTISYFVTLLSSHWLFRESDR